MHLRKFLPYGVMAGLVAAAALGAACGGDDDDGGLDVAGNPDAGPGTGDGQSPLPGKFATEPNRGSAIALSEDDTVAVAVNRDSGSISVFDTKIPDDGSAPTITRRTELAVGDEPWQVTLSADGDTAYVVTRKSQELVKVTGIRTTPVKAGAVRVGSEPTAVALLPSGTSAIVANWVDGTLSVVDTTSLKVASTVDLNAAIAASSYMPPGTKARPSLAHPRSIAITNATSDAEASIYVTEYFAQQIAPVAADGANLDESRAGVVYRVKLGATPDVKLIRLSPLKNLKVKNGETEITLGCFPNQLQSITINEGNAYVTSVCASPKGPLNVKANTHGAVSVISLATESESTGSASLTALWDQEFQKAGTPEAANDGTGFNVRRYPGVPTDVAFPKGTNVGYVAANAADAVFRVVYKPDGSIETLGSSVNKFIDMKSGQNPIGVATSHTQNARYAIVANDLSRNVVVLDLNQQKVAGGDNAIVAESTTLPTDGKAKEVHDGKRFFNTGRGRWSLGASGISACQSCHVDGYTDNVTWAFARGPRQSTSLEGSFSKKDPTDQRLFNWGAIFDEVSDFEGNTRGVSGGVGAIVKASSTPPTNADRIVATDAVNEHAGLNGSSFDLADPGKAAVTATNGDKGTLADWAHINEYVKVIRAPKKPSNLDAALVTAGETAFKANNCQGCHGGDKWTISKRFYAPSLTVNEDLKGKSWDGTTGSLPAKLLPATAGNRFMRRAGATNAGLDQFVCALRPVGTIKVNAGDATKNDGVTDGFVGVAEVRQDMTTKGQGLEAEGSGYNPPSLLGLQVGAPYFHAGNAATLESLFTDSFKEHHTALAELFLSETGDARATKVAQMVAYLLSIDGDTTVVPAPAAVGATGGSFCAP